MVHVSLIFFLKTVTINFIIHTERTSFPIHIFRFMWLIIKKSLMIPLEVLGPVLLVLENLQNLRLAFPMYNETHHYHLKICIVSCYTYNYSQIMWINIQNYDTFC